MAEPYLGPSQELGLGRASVVGRAGAGVAPGPIAHSTAGRCSLGTPAHGKRATVPDRPARTRARRSRLPPAHAAQCTRAVRRSRDRLGRSARPESRPRGVVDTLTRGKPLEGLSPGDSLPRAGVCPVRRAPAGRQSAGRTCTGRARKGKRRQCAVGLTGPPGGRSHGWVTQGQRGERERRGRASKTGGEVRLGQKEKGGKSAGLPLEHANTCEIRKAQYL